MSINYSDASAASPGDPPYLHLCTRAEAFVRERGGAVTEDELIAFVFGNRGSASLWSNVLRQALTHSQTIALRDDGRWALPHPLLPSLSFNLDFVALDVETTGLHPLNQRIIEIALIKYSHGRELDRFVSYVHPEKRVPKYISTLTGIVDHDLESAPKFGEIAGLVEAFIGDSVLLGHNVEFDIRFLNAELGRSGRVQLINDRIDTMGLAMRLLSSLKRPSLDRVAKELGLSPRKIHRAADDAVLTAAVALRLFERASAIGIDSLERLRSASTPLRSRPKDGIGRGRALLDRSILAEMPRAPGVYIMRDKFERVIYVGKAKSLRDRVASYFSQPLGYTRKMDGLIESIARIDIELTGSELQALLLESQLIKRYQPRYNTVLRSAEHYPYIRIDQSSPWPKVTLARSRKADGSTTFGPFRSARAVRTAVDLINDHFPLRTCTRSFKNARSFGSPCLRLDLKQCLGPCVGRADRDEYMTNVRKVIAFLEGDEEMLFDRIWADLEIAAEKLDYERARRLKNQLSSLRSIVAAERTMSSVVARGPLLLAQRAASHDAVSVLMISGGRIWSSHLARREDGPSGLAGQLHRSWNRLEAHERRPIDQLGLDETQILGRWLRKNDGSPLIFELEPAALSWDETASRVLQLGSEEFDWLPRDVDEEDSGEDIVLVESDHMTTEDPAGEVTFPINVSTLELVTVAALSGP